MMATSARGRSSAGMVMTLTSQSLATPALQPPQRSACATPGRWVRGFTLIEMLVVLLIMGLCVGLVGAVAQPDNKALLQVEAERMAQLMELAATESRLTGKPIAWTADGPGYRFLRFSEDSGWSRIDDGLLRARVLPHGIRLSNMHVENLQSPERMRVEFNSHGAVLSFSVEMSLGDVHYTVTVSPIGQVRVLPERGKANDRPA